LLFFYHNIVLQCWTSPISPFWKSPLLHCSQYNLKIWDVKSIWNYAGNFLFFAAILASLFQ
jgi:hypothetical protein